MTLCTPSCSSTILAVLDVNRTGRGLELDEATGEELGGIGRLAGLAGLVGVDTQVLIIETVVVVVAIG